MDRIVPRILLFDRFVLDLTRGCLRAGDQDLALRPKAFEVLCHLVENAGRLVAKKELHDAVWGDIAVSDDSIVQCIRELRAKLGDVDHRLIKTVPRRGYLLDATVSPEGPQGPGAVPPRGSQARLGGTQLYRTIPWVKLRAAHALIACLLLAAVGWAVYHVVRPVSVASPTYVDRPEKIVATALSSAAFKDCEDCPEMVALPAGDFLMGSPESESGHQDVEGLPRRVIIGNRVAIGKFEITVDQFSSFVIATGMKVSDHCRVIVGSDRVPPAWAQTEASFRHPGFKTGGLHPVVCVSWHEAQAYAAWLQRRTGKPYRLPTEAEWEYAARAGTKTRYSFGDDETMLCDYAKFADFGSQFGWRDACRSELVAFGPAPVGSFRPNPWGIFDTHGNAWEWVQDCWTPDASKIPTDGSAFMQPKGCEEGVTRGGSFAAPSQRVRSAMRAPAPTAIHNYNIGFRVALSLGVERSARSP